MQIMNCRTPLSSLAVFCLSLFAGCTLYGVPNEDGGESTETMLRVSYFDKSGGASSSVIIGLESKDVEQGAEELQPFRDADFWIKVKGHSGEKVALSVRLEGQPAEELELLPGERREFRPKDSSKRIAVSVCRSYHSF